MPKKQQEIPVYRIKMGKAYTGINGKKYSYNDGHPGRELDQPRYSKSVFSLSHLSNVCRNWNPSGGG